MAAKTNNTVSRRRRKEIQSSQMKLPLHVFAATVTIVTLALAWRGFHQSPSPPSLLGGEEVLTFESGPSKSQSSRQPSTSNSTIDLAPSSTDEQTTLPETPDPTESEIATTLQNLPLTEPNRAQAENLTQQWAALNLPAALAWTLAQPQTDTRDRLLQRIAFIQAKQFPRDAAILIVQKIQPGPFQSQAALTILHQWALQDPAAANAWINLFPPGDLKTRAQRELENVQATPEN
jgi:hypothetical protein